MSPALELPQGTLDLLVLRVLRAGEMHGWGVAQRLSLLSKEALQLQEGTIYPALYRMEAKGWIASEWAASDNGVAPGVFLPTAQVATTVRFVMRGHGDLATLTRDVRRTIEGIDPGLSTRFASMQAQVDATLVGDRLMATLSGGFGVLASVLAVVGLYGLVAYMVARRHVEIGVRLALGAQRLDIMRLILAEVAWLLAAGVAIGSLMAIAAGRFAGTLLFGLVPHDPATIAMGVVLLATAGAIASAWPARRACHVDPLVALREA